MSEHALSKVIMRFTCAALAAVSAIALVPMSASATETRIISEAGSSEDAPECEDDTCPDEGEAPPPADPGFVEELPPAEMLARLPMTNDSWTRNWTRTVGRGADGHYCGSFYIQHVSYTFNYEDDYTRIHVQPAWFYRKFIAGTDPSIDLNAWDALANCINTRGPHGVYVHSWDAIEDQFLCHAAAGPFVGSSWDLEGHREAANNRFTRIVSFCNW